eukprot:TRINITY_DN9079_c0_g1_i1.p1 TRINITY_DN9079_c0_g1~~TRINITY_DN9079_c0_g1_i1.p1  ORF type:complete len:683 (+),score=57.13 TRINITY_DN9079_c0_g1_i1:59-2107(+)
MEFCFCTATICFAIGVLLVLTQGLFFIREHAQAIRAFMVRCASFFRAWKNWPRYCVKLCQCHCSSDSSLGDALLATKLSQRRLEAMSSVLVTVSAIFSIGITGILMRMLLQMDMGGTYPQMVSLFVASSVSMCASYVFTLTHELLEFCYVTIMIAVSFYIWYSPHYAFVLNLSLSCVVQLVLSTTFMNIRSVLSWNLVVFGSSFVYALREPLTSPLRSVIFLFLIVMFALNVLAAVGFKRWAVSSASQETYISSLKIENSASLSLLDLVCDVVVQLDNKLNIKHDSRAFKAMLMKTGGSTTKGLPFTHFIADQQERQKFERHLLAAQSAPEGNVGTFRTMFTDSLRNCLHAEMFYVPVQMDVNVTHFLIGVRECNEADAMHVGQSTDVMESQVPNKDEKKVTPPSHKRRKGTPSSCERAELREQVTPPQVVASDHLQSPHLRATDGHLLGTRDLGSSALEVSPHANSPHMDTVEPRSPAQRSDGASSISSDSSRLGDQSGVGFRNIASIALVLDILDRSLPVLEANIRFKVPADEESSDGEQHRENPALSSCLSARRLRSFDNWLQAGANAVMYGGSAPFYGGVTLRPPGLFSMSAKRAYAENVEEDTVRVRFEDVTLQALAVHVKGKRSSQYYQLASRSAPHSSNECIPIGRPDISYTQPLEGLQTSSDDFDSGPPSRLML